MDNLIVGLVVGVVITLLIIWAISKATKKKVEFTKDAESWWESLQDRIDDK